jgi:Brp/Blh family beta-carotene 15,15'-monooxygenase
MNYINSKLFFTQCIIQIAFIFLVLVFNFSITTQAVIAGVFLCIVGIPHGSNDYLYRKDRTFLGLLKFLGSYLGVIFIYALVWYYLPLIALILFFAISFHHFGQSNHENKNVWDFISIFWGFCMIMLPVIIHFEEALLIFKSMLVTNSVYNANQYYPANFNTFKIIIISILAIAYLLNIFILKKENKLKYTIQFVLMFVWYLLTPLLFGFIMVFCLWHSLQSLRHQKNYFTSKYNQSSKYFYLSMLPFSIIALLFFGCYLYSFHFNVGGAFILLSLITLPHVLVTHQQYEAES